MVGACFIITVKFRQLQSSILPALIFTRHGPRLIAAPAKSADECFYDLSHPECLSFSALCINSRHPPASIRTSVRIRLSGNRHSRKVHPSAGAGSACIRTMPSCWKRSTCRADISLSAPESALLPSVLQTLLLLTSWRPHLQSYPYLLRLIPCWSQLPFQGGRRWSQKQNADRSESCSYSL